MKIFERNRAGGKLGASVRSVGLEDDTLGSGCSEAIEINDIKDSKASSNMRGTEKAIAELNKCTSLLEELCTKIGTDEDNKKLRDQIQAVSKEGEYVFKAIYQQLRKDQAPETLSRMAWFRAELDRFKKIRLRVPMDTHQSKHTPVASPSSRVSYPFGDAGDLSTQSVKGVNNTVSSMNESHMSPVARQILVPSTPTVHSPAHRKKGEKATYIPSKRERKSEESVKIEAMHWEAFLCRTPKWVRLLGVMFGLIVIIYSLYELAVFNSRVFGDAVRYVIFLGFGLLVILAEFRVGKVLEWFSLLKTASGLGGYYLFVGVSAIGRGGIFGWVVFAMAALTALFYFIMAIRFREIYYDDDDLDDLELAE